MKDIYEGKINVINWDEEFYFIFRVNVSEGIEEANDFLLTFDPRKVILTSTEKDYRYGEPSPYGLVDNGAATKFLKYRFKLKDYVDSGKTKIVLSDYDGNVLASYDLDIKGTPYEVIHERFLKNVEKLHKQEEEDFKKYGRVLER